MIIGIIPSRFASSRFPGKALAKILKKSLVQHTYENSLESALFDDLFVATDDPRIAEHVKEFGGKAIMTGPALNGTARIIQALENEPQLANATCIVNIQGDHPCIEKATIEAVVLALNSDETAQMATAVCPISEEEAASPNTVKCVFDKNLNALYFSRALIPYQKTPVKVYYHHIGIYAYRPSFLKMLAKLEDTPLQGLEDLEQLKALENSYKIKIAIVKETPLGVDVPEDIAKVEKYLCQ